MGSETRKAKARIWYHQRMQDLEYAAKRRAYSREQAKRSRRAKAGFTGSRWAPLSERFWSLVQKGDGCWLWLGTFNKGYGQIQVGGKFCRAHRIAYELTHGVTLTPEQVLCHHCDNPACVRPDHMFVGTHADNVADMIRKGRNRGGWGSRKSYRTRAGKDGQPGNSQQELEASNA